MTKIVTSLDNLAFMLQDMPDSIKTMRPQDVLHAIDESLTKWERNMPKGATRADFWMLTNGDPLTSTDAALKLAKQAGFLISYQLGGILTPHCNASLSYTEGDFKGGSDTLARAIVIAIVNYKNQIQLSQKGD